MNFEKPTLNYKHFSSQLYRKEIRKSFEKRWVEDKPFLWAYSLDLRTPYLHVFDLDNCILTIYDTYSGSVVATINTTGRLLKSIISNYCTLFQDSDIFPNLNLSTGNVTFIDNKCKKEYVFNIAINKYLKDSENYLVFDIDKFDLVKENLWLKLFDYFNIYYMFFSSSEYNNEKTYIEFTKERNNVSIKLYKNKDITPDGERSYYKRFTDLNQCAQCYDLNGFRKSQAERFVNKLSKLICKINSLDISKSDNYFDKLKDQIQDLKPFLDWKI